MPILYSIQFATLNTFSYELLTVSRKIRLSHHPHMRGLLLPLSIAYNVLPYGIVVEPFSKQQSRNLAADYLSGVPAIQQISLGHVTMTTPHMFTGEGSIYVFISSSYSQEYTLIMIEFQLLRLAFISASLEEINKQVWISAPKRDELANFRQASPHSFFR